MIDAIYINFLSAAGIIILFVLTNGVKEFLIEDLIHDDWLVTEFKEHHEKYFREKYRKLLVNGFLVCLFISFLSSYALGKATCDEVDYTTQTCATYEEDDSFTPTTIQRTGVFTKVFSYTYIIVLITASEGKKRHYQNIENCSKNKTT